MSDTQTNRSHDPNEPTLTRSEEHLVPTASIQSTQDDRRPTGPPSRSIVSRDSCSLMPAAATSERSVRWRTDLKEDDEAGPSTERTGSDESQQTAIARTDDAPPIIAQEAKFSQDRAGTASLSSAESGPVEAGTTKGAADVIAELQRDIARLRREQEQLRRLNKTDFLAERLHEMRTLQDKVSKLQEEVGERRGAHNKEMQRRQAELRRLGHDCEASRDAVERVRVDNQALRRSFGQTAAATPVPPATAITDLQVKLDKARCRLRRAERELDEKRRHPKKVLNSVDSLEELRNLWTSHVTLLEDLQRRDAQRSRLRDRVDMFARNVDILRAENAGLAARLHEVHAQLKAFVDFPMTPTAFVEKNVSLLLHMEKIESTLAEKAVELDEQEAALKLEQNKVRELLVTLEGLRRENRHINRRLQKAAAFPATADAAPVPPLEHRTPWGSQNLSLFLLPIKDAERQLGVEGAAAPGESRHTLHLLPSVPSASALLLARLASDLQTVEVMAMKRGSSTMSLALPPPPNTSPVLIDFEDRAEQDETELRVASPSSPANPSSPASPASPVSPNPSTSRG